MVWDGGSKPLVVPTRWDLLGVALGGAPVWPSSGGVGFTEKSVVRHTPCYLPLEQLIVNFVNVVNTCLFLSNDIKRLMCAVLVAASCLLSSDRKE